MSKCVSCGQNEGLPERQGLCWECAAKAAAAAEPVSGSQGPGVFEDVEVVGPPSSPPVKRYGGIRRGPYWLGMVGLFILNAIFRSAPDPGVAMLGLVITVPLAIVLAYNRLVNIEMNGALAFLLLVPIVNLIIGVRCAVMPEGYEDTKKLDDVGRILLAVILLGVFLALIALVVQMQQLQR